MSTVYYGREHSFCGNNWLGKNEKPKKKLAERLPNFTTAEKSDLVHFPQVTFFRKVYFSEVNFIRKRCALKTDHYLSKVLRKYLIVQKELAGKKPSVRHIFSAKNKLNHGLLKGLFIMGALLMRVKFWVKFKKFQYC